MLDVERWRFTSYIRECTVVTFPRISYAEAVRRARRQDRIVYASLIAATLSILLLSIFLFHLIVHSADGCCGFIAGGANCQRRFARVR